MLNNFVNFDFLFIKLSGIDHSEKHNNIPGGHAWRQFSMTCSKLEAMAIYRLVGMLYEQWCISVVQHTIYNVNYLNYYHAQAKQRLHPVSKSLWVLSL